MPMHSGGVALTYNNEVQAWKTQLSRDVQYGLRHARHSQSTPELGAVNDVRSTSRKKLPHVGTFDASLAVSTGFELLVPSSAALKAEKMRQRAEFMEDLAPTIEEITGRKRVYPGGWGELEDDPSAHLRDGPMFSRGGGIQPWDQPPASSLRLDNLPVEINTRRLPLTSVHATQGLEGTARPEDVRGNPSMPESIALKPQMPNSIKPTALTVSSPTGDVKPTPVPDRAGVVRARMGKATRTIGGVKYYAGINMQPPGTKFKLTGGPSLAGFRHYPSRSDESRPTTMPLPWRPIHTTAPQRLGAESEIKIKGWPGC